MNKQKDDKSRSGKHTVSARKVEANRLNARNSTGPRTRTGKAYSRRNALRHGLFALEIIPDFLGSRENQLEFQSLRGQLQQQLEPSGIAEELEVERISVCWWRLRRAWFYENAQTRLALINIAQLNEDAKRVMIPEHRAVSELLKGAEKEIELTGEISQESKEKIFETHPPLRKVWEKMEELVRQQRQGVLARQPRLSLAQADSGKATLSKAELIDMTKMAIECLELIRNTDREFVRNIACDLQALPDDDALGRVLRSEAAIERSLSRSLDRLERLQRRRKGESVPLPRRVNFTR